MPTVTALPALDRISATFKADVDTFFATQLPTFTTEVNTLETNVNAKEASAVASAATATTQAGLATTNGAAQVALATTQAGLATTNGAAQVALATTQAGLALNYANVAASSINFIGAWSAQTGAVAAFKTVYHNSKYWIALNAIANVAVSEPGISADWSQVGKGIDNYLYDNRSNLRTTTPQAGDTAIVDGLGLFVFYSGSTEPDDDESCFATATGKWLLEAAHWDVVDTWQLPDDEARDAWDEDEPLRFASKILTGTATSAITSVASVTQVSFTGTVTGAAVGDRVVSNPHNAVGALISTYCRVTAADTVTIYLNNPSAAAQTITAGTWNLTVIKE